ncbi:MAG TPA: hypothetical protein VK586_15090 [Streptosporangiaceae bacterium]|nr:hypothetical protein [Streptosporangiaceae bacterium]
MAGFRDGTSASLQAVPKATPFEATIPEDVAAGDVMLICVTCFTFAAASPGIALSSPAGAWQQLAGLQDSGTGSGLDAYGAVFTRVATSGDAGSTLTFGFTGTAGTDEMWWAAALGAWTGFAGASVADGTGVLNGTPACPAASTATDNEWAVYLGAMAVEGGGSVTGVPAGSALRENVSAAGVCAVIADGNGAAGQAGTAIGGGAFTVSNPTNWLTTFTVTLAPALTVTFTGTDGNGVDSYRVSSIYNAAPDVTTLRALRPTSPGAFPHSFIYALPVVPGLDSSFGDGLDVMRGLGAHNTYNTTIVEPTFGDNPWYADNPLNPSLRHETFMLAVAGWVQANLAVTGTEAHHLIGFSKSGIGGQDLALKHPDVWTRTASWDFPANMDVYNQFGANSGDAYGTDANFQSSYRLTSGFVSARAAPFITANRLWIGGGNTFQSDVTAYHALLTSLGIQHSYSAVAEDTHNWNAGWVPAALAALFPAPAPPAIPGLLLSVFP